MLEKRVGHYTPEALADQSNAVSHAAPNNLELNQANEKRKNSFTLPEFGGVSSVVDVPAIGWLKSGY